MSRPTTIEGQGGEIGLYRVNSRRGTSGIFINRGNV